MTLPVLFRRAAAVLLVAAAGLAALPGCGSSKPQPDKKDEKKPDGDKKDGPGDTGTKKDDAGGPPPSAGITDPFKDVDTTAKQVFATFTQSPESAKADLLSAGFLRAIGKPLSPDDIESKRPANLAAATRWLIGVGRGRERFGAIDPKQAGPAAFFRGPVYGRGLGANGGSYSLRLLKESDAWKIDALVVSSLEWKNMIKGGTADEAFQEFAATAFVEALCDAGGMSADERPQALARLTHPDLLKSWAAPASQDTAQGYAYNTAKLDLKAKEIGGDTSAFTLARTGGTAFTAELTRPAGKKTLTLKLTQGTTPGEWLVSEVGEKG